MMRENIELTKDEVLSLMELLYTVHSEHLFATDNVSVLEKLIKFAEEKEENV